MWKKCTESKKIEINKELQKFIAKKYYLILKQGKDLNRHLSKRDMKWLRDLLKRLSTSLLIVEMRIIIKK